MHHSIFDSDETNSKIAIIIGTYILFGFGIILLFPSTICYISIIPMVEDSIKEKIFAHLEGNKVLSDNIASITATRGMLKLDTLVNLEFFTCLVYILLQAQVFDPEDDQADDWLFIAPWVVTILLLVMIIWANYHGATTAVSLNLFLTLFFLARFS